MDEEGELQFFFVSCFLIGATVEQIEAKAFSELLMSCATLYGVPTSEAANWF